EHPPALFYNPEKRALVPLTEPDGKSAWTLCQDDAVLDAAGLPRFGDSLSRYLYQPGKPGQARFIAVTEPPTGDLTRSLADAIGDAPLVPFNPEGGLLMVKEYFPLSLDDFVNVLSGRPLDGRGNPALVADVHAAELKALASVNGAGYLYWGPPSLTGRL